jgi:hypothetical protein
VNESNNDDLVPMVIDFAAARNTEGKLDESWILTFGAILRWMMPSLYKGSVLPLVVKGTAGEVKSFANVLGKEKKYLQSWKNNGLDNPLTYQNKTKLGRAVSQFERVTGLKWPFKK